MRINGEWLLFDDDILRPVIRGEILTEAGAWQQGLFAVVVDQPGDVVCLLSQRHGYTIEQE
jgi:hypothetical protein